MATQKKAADPTEAALSAIEEALALSINGTPARASEGMRDVAPKVVENRGVNLRARSATAMARSKTGQDADSQSESVEFETKGVPGGRPANDDRREIGEILQALQAGPSSRPYALAALGSAVWGGGLTVVAASRLEWSWEAMRMALASAEGLAFAVGIGVPAAAMFVVASLARRSQEMKVVAQSMTRVVIRLAEPEVAATDAVVGLSQAIRREVAAMGDGIERAVARASELETIVHAEIATLEHAYNQNEIRLRTLIDELAGQREAIVTHADRVRTALAGAHDGLASELEAAADKIAGSVNDAGLRVARTLGEKAEEISGTLARTGEEMVRQVGDQSGELIDRLVSTNSDMARRLSDTAATVTERLDGKASEITSAITRTGELVALEIAGRGNEVRETLERTSSSIAQSLSTGTELLSQSVFETGRSVSDTIAARAESLNEALRLTGESVAQSIDVQGRAVIGRLGSVADEVGDRIEAGGDRIVQTINDTTGRLEDLISVRGPRLAEDIESTAARLVSTVEVQIGSARTALEAGTRSVAETITQRSAEFTALVDGRLDGFEKTFEARALEFSDVVVERASSLAAVIETHSAQLTERMTDIETGVLARGEAIASTIESSTSDFGARIEQSLATVQNLLDTRGDSIATAVDTAAGRFEIRIDERLQTARALFDSRGEAIASVLESSTSAFENRLSERTEEIRAMFEQRGQSLELAVTRYAADAGAFVDSKLGEFEQRTVAGTERMGSRLGEIFVQLDQGLAQRSRSLSEAVAMAAVDAAKSFGDSAETVRLALDERATAFEEVVVGRSTELVSRIDDRAGELTGILSDRTRELSSTIDEGVRRLEDNVAGRLAGLVESIDERSSHLVETLSTRSENVSSTLGRRVEELAAIFDGRGTELVEQIRSQGDLVGSTLATAGESVTREIAGVGEAVLRTLEGRSVSITGVLRERSRELIQTVDEAAASLRNAFDDRGTETAEQFARLTTLLREESDPILARVETLGRSLGEVVTTAGDSLKDVDRVLGERVGALRQTLDLVQRDTSEAAERLALQAAALRDSSSSVLENAATIAQRFETGINGLASVTDERLHALSSTAGVISDRFEAHLAALTDVTDDRIRTLDAVAAEQLRTLNATVEAVSRLERSVQQTAADREHALSRIMDEIGNRSAEFETTAGLYTERVSSFLEDAEARAREIGALLTDISGTTSRALEEQLATLRDSIVQERRRIADSLRDAYEGSLRQMSDTLGNSTERFRATADELRVMTGEVARELEDTRSELRRTLADLPRESHEAAGTVRDMIGEQIKALEELNALAASGPGFRTVSVPRTEAAAAPDRSVDAIGGPIFSSSRPQPASAIQRPSPFIPPEPVVPQAPTPITPPSPVIPAAAASATSPENRTNAAPGPHSRTLDPGMPGSFRSSSEERPLRPILDGFAPRRAAQPAVAVANPKENPALGGWLSDLLARASEDDEPGIANEPPATMEMVTRLTAEAPRLTRPDLLSAFWDGHASGDQRSSFRTALTLEGITRAEDFRRRYARDEAFRTIVDAYVAKFDDLLSDIRETERGQAVVRTAFASNEGKVYALFAYAAGRIA
jgi:hypothetical protein